MVKTQQPKKITDYVELSNTRTWPETTQVQLSELIDTNITIVEFARVMFGTELAFAYKTSDNTEFVTGSMALVQLGEKLLASSAVVNIRKHEKFENTTIYELDGPIEFSVTMKKSPKTGREFYVVVDPTRT